MRDELEILALNAFDPHTTAAVAPGVRQSVERRLRSFGASSVLFYKEPIEVVRAEGVFVHAADGRRYLDVYNNVPSVGHSHPRVVEAIQKQVAILNINTRYLNELVDRYAERLLATFPPSITNLVMTCTGSEANDLALRVAQSATGGTGFVVTHAAYHGNTAAVTDISPSSRPGRPLPRHVRSIPPPDAYRGDGRDPGLAMAEALVEAIADMKKKQIRFAGAIFDSAFSSDGVFTDPVGLLKPVVEAVHAHGGLFIADEVQPGFGRTGASLWGFARHGIVPDIVTMGKPMGNGFPMGGMALWSDLLSTFCEHDKYFNTFGGNPVAAAAGLAVLDVIRDEGLIENARIAGDHLRAGLRELSNKHKVIGDVRGAGLFTGLEFVSDRKTKAVAPEIATAVINGLRDQGVLIGAAGPFGNILKIRPPLCFSTENAETVVAAIDTVLKARKPGKARR